MGDDEAYTPAEPAETEDAVFPSAASSPRALENDLPFGGKPMDVAGHLEELRSRVIKCMIFAAVGACLGWFLYEPFIYEFLMQPLKGHLDPNRFRITWLNIMEPLLMRVTVSAIAGVVMMSPLIFYQVWAFVYPALFPRERRYLRFVIPASFLLFASGVTLAYLGVPVLFLFAARFVTPDADVLNTVKWYIPFLTKVCLAMGLVFQMPVAFFFLAKLGLVRSGFLLNKWRHAIICIFTAAAIITPTPDVVNMTLLAAPILGLYFLSIVIVRFTEPRESSDAQCGGA